MPVGSGTQIPTSTSGYNTIIGTTASAYVDPRYGSIFVIDCTSLGVSSNYSFLVLDTLTNIASSYPNIEIKIIIKCLESNGVNLYFTKNFGTLSAIQSPAVYNGADPVITLISDGSRFHVMSAYRWNWI